MKHLKFYLAMLLVINSATLLSQIWTEQTSPTANTLWGAWVVNSFVVWMGGNSGTVIKTTNSGTTWNLASGNMPSSVNINTISAINQNICLAGTMNGVWRTTDGGITWYQINIAPATDSVDVIHMFDSNTGFLIADPIALQWGYYITTNGGENWTLGANAPAAVAGEFGFRSGYAALDTGHIWWGTNVSKIWKGSFRGPFISAPTTGSISRSIAFNNENSGIAIMYNINTPLNITTTGGMSWTTGSTISYYTHSVKAIPNTGFIWIGCGLGQILRSTDFGVTFQLQALTNAGQIYAMSMLDQGLGWIGTISGRIFKYTDLTGFGNQNNEFANDYRLDQNYPNPFNPTTKISFALPQAGNVKLVVFDILGMEAATLLNEVLQTGSYEVEWNAANYPSGVYFYKLSTADFSETKKMILTK